MLWKTVTPARNQDSEPAIAESGIDPFAQRTRSSMNPKPAPIRHSNVPNDSADLENPFCLDSRTEILLLRKQVHTQSVSLDKYQRKYERLKTQYEQSKTFINNMCDYLDIQPPSFKQNIGTIDIADYMMKQGQNIDHPPQSNLVLTDLNQNDQVVPHARRYSIDSKSFWSGVGLRSASTLEFIGKILKVPSMKTVSRHTSEGFSRRLIRLQDLNTFHLELEEYRKQCGIEDEIFGTLSVDAVSTTSNLTTEEREVLRSKLHADAFSDTVELDIFLEQINTHNTPDTTMHDVTDIAPLVNRPHFVHYKYLFVFYFEPICANLKPTVVYVEKSTNGKASKEWSRILYDIADKMKSHRVTPILLASDGDNGYDHLFLSDFKRFTMNNQLNPTEIINYDFSTPLIVTDILHFLKNARSKLIFDSISPNVRIPNAINLNAVKKTLTKVKTDVWDSSSLSKMVDFFPIELFTFENTRSLLLNNQNQAAVYFAINSFLREGILNSKLDIDQRSQLFEIGMIFSMLYYNYLNDCTNDGFTYYEKKRNNYNICMFTKIQCIRCFNTCLAHFIIIHKFLGPISLGRLGTHPLENFFGYLRGLCRSDDQIDNFLRQIAKACILKEIDHLLDIHKDINKRLNISGVKIMGGEFNDQNYQKSHDIAVSMLSIIDNDYCISKSLTRRSPLDLFVANMPKDELKLTNPGLISGSSILTHLIHATNLTKAEKI